MAKSTAGCILHGKCKPYCLHPRRCARVRFFRHDPAKFADKMADDLGWRRLDEPKRPATASGDSHSEGEGP